MPENYSEEAGVSGTQAIKKIRGMLTEQKRVESKFEASEMDDGKGGKKMVQPKDQIQVKMTDVAILEMFDNVEVPDLPEGDFTFWIPFAAKGQMKAHANSPFQKCWVDTAMEAYKKAPSQLNGTYVTLDKLPKVLFKPPVTDTEGKLILDSEGKKTYTEVLSVDKNGRAKYFCFVKDEGIAAADLPKYIAGKIEGLTKKMALKTLMTDTRVSQFPQYKEKLQEDPEGFAKDMGMNLIDDKFVSVS